MTYEEYGTQTYGSGGYGLTYSGDTLVGNWPFKTIVPTDQEPLYDILTVVENQLGYLDREIDALRRQRFIEDADGAELRKLAAEVGVSRETGESTERFRFRARLAKAIARSDGTYPDLAVVLRFVFGDSVDKVSLEPVSGEPVTRVRVPSALIEDIPVSTSELATILLDAVPAGDGIEVITDETFLLGQSGSQGLSNGELS